MTLEVAKKPYPNEWIAFRIDKDGASPARFLNVRIGIRG